MRTALRTLFYCMCYHCPNQSTKKGKLVCESGYHGCPALHRRARPVAPRDNHSLAEGHLFRVDARVAKPVSLLNLARILPESNPYQTL